MAKIKPSLFGKVSGKIDKTVFVDSPATTPHLRKAPKERKRKIERALKEQFSRSKMLNRLASDINSIVHRHIGEFKSAKYYSNCLSRFRKASTGNRFLLLHQLIGLEAHPTYPLSKLGDCSMAVEQQKGKFVVDLRVMKQPRPGKHQANCYSYELIFITWAKGKERASALHQYSDWVMIRNKLPYFDFVFNPPAGTEHWLICLRQRLGIDEKAVDVYEAQGMQIVEVGTTNKKDMELLKEWNENNKEKIIVKSEEKVVRVKPKGFKD